MTTNLRSALDRLSQEIDPGKYEQRRFEREEGAFLNQAVAITKDAFPESGFTVISFDQLGKSGTGFIVQVEGTGEVVGNLHLAVDRTDLRIWFENKGNFTMNRPGQPSTVPLSELNDKLVEDAIADQMRRVRFTGRPL